MDIPINVSAGDSGPVWLVGHFEDTTGQWTALDAGYSCVIAVEGTNISRPVTGKTNDNLYFVASLTPAETALLEVGKLQTVAVQISNTQLSPTLVKEIKFKLFIVSNVVA